MPEITPKLGLKKRLGNETVRRLDWNENYDQLDLIAAREPFLLKSYSYDLTNDQITLTIGPGRGSFLSSVVDKSADSIFNISAPVPNTSYFVFLKSDGTFTHNSTGSLIQNAVLLHSFTTGATVDVITPTDHRGEISGDAQSLSASLIPSNGNSNVQADIDNLKSSVSSGKQQVSGAITGKGGTVADADGDGVSTFQELAEGVSSIPQAQGDVTVDEVIEGATFTSAVYGATVQTGTMPNNGSLGTITPGTTNKSIPPGYTSGGTILGDPDLVSGNIKSGANIFGVTGKASVVETADATATSGQILYGQSGYVNGSKVTGTMPNNGALGTYTPGTTNQSIPAGYTSGGTVSGDPDLISANIKSGSNVFGVVGKASVVETSDATAASGDMLSGKTAYVNGAKVTGTIPSQAGSTTTPNPANQTIVPAGVFVTAPIVVAGDPDLVSSNIKSGANIFGVTGKTSVVETSDATAAAAYILSGKTAYVNGAKVTGTIPSDGAKTITPGTANQTAISAGRYASGTITVVGDADLVPGNIRKGTTVFGVTGDSLAYGSGDILNVRDLSTDMSPVVKNIVGWSSNQCEFGIGSISNKTFAIGVGSTANSNLTVTVSDNGNKLFTVNRGSVDVRAVIALSDGYYANVDGNYVYKRDSGFNTVAGTSPLSYNNGSNMGIVISYEVNGKLIIVSGSLQVAQIDIATWTLEFSGVMTGRASSYEDDLRYPGWDWAGNTVYCKMGGLGGDLITFDMTENPTCVKRVNNFNSLHATVNSTSTEMHCFNSSTNQIDVFDTTTWAKLRSYAIQTNETGSTITSWSSIGNIKFLENENAIMVFSGFYRYLIDPSNGAFLYSYYTNNSRTDYSYPLWRVGRTKDDAFMYWDPTAWTDTFFKTTVTLS